MAKPFITNRKVQGGPVLDLDFAGGIPAVEKAGLTVGGSPAEVGSPYGAGLNFNGTTDYIVLPANYKTMPEAWSVEALINTGSPGGSRPVVGWRNTSTDPGVFPIFSNRSLIYMGANNYRYFNWAPVDITDGDWHHCVWTLPGSAQADINSANMYADGQSQTVNFTTATGAQTAKDICNIGRANPGGGALYLSGSLQFVRMYARELSAADVTALYNSVIMNKLPI
jgi:hypothetical protein